MSEPIELKVMSYVLGTHTGWEGDQEEQTFYGYVPVKTIEGWPESADVITINSIEGTVYAFGNGPDPIKQWGWRDFIAMI